MFEVQSGKIKAINGVKQNNVYSNEIHVTDKGCEEFSLIKSFDSSEV